MKNKLVIDAVILAGTHKNPERLVHKQNKAFLPMHGKPVIQHVIEAFAAAPEIGKIAVVGPQELLERELLTCEATFIGVPERGSFLQNAWIGYRSILDKESEFLDLKQIRELLGRDLPHLMPFKPLEVKDEITAEIARTLAEEQLPGMQLYRLERLVDEYYITKRRHGFLDPAERQEEMIRAIVADQRLFVVDNNVCSFRDPLMEKYFATLGGWIQKPVIYTSGDVPLVTPQAVSDFINRCRPFNHDFYFGMNERRDLIPYRPTDDKPGLIRPFLQFHEFSARAANINLVRPKKIGNAVLIQQSFNIRKLKEWKNVLRLMRLVYQVSGGVKSISYVALFQLALVLSRYGRHFLSRQVRRLLPVFKIEGAATRLLQTDFKIILSPFGGLSIDIDSVDDYNIIGQRFRDWIELQRQIAEKVGYDSERGQNSGEHSEPATEGEL